MLTMTNSGLALGADLDLRAELDRPGVRLLAVEFYATWCKPCMEAVPKWKALHDAHRSDGLRLIVVAERDPDGACKNPGWTPDAIVCDDDGAIAKAFGAADALPVSFLWNWQGNLLVRSARVEDIAARIDEQIKVAPRVRLEIDGVGASARIAPTTLAALIRSSLARGNKIVVIADESDRKRLDAIKADSYRPNHDDALQCEIGKELSANSLLRVQIGDTRAGPRLSASVFSAEKGCLNASAITVWNPSAPEASVADVISSMLRMLRRDPQILATPKPDEPITEREAFLATRSDLAKRCLDGELKACTSLGSWVEMPQWAGFQPDYDTARAAFSKACKGGDLEGCHNFAGYVPDDEAAKLEARACAGGVASACGSLGFDYARGKGVRHDAKKALELLTRACNAGDRAECGYLGRCLRDGLPLSNCENSPLIDKKNDPAARKDPSKALSMFNKGCRLDDLRSCSEAGAMLLSNMSGVPPDVSRAIRFLEKACPEDKAAFDRRTYREFASLHPDASEEQINAACDKEVEHEDERRHAVWPYPVGAACATIAMLADHGDGVLHDRNRAWEYAWRGCDARDAKACFLKATIGATGQESAANVLESCCGFAGRSSSDPAVGECCTELSWHYHLGTGVSKDPAKSAELADKACRLGSSSGCVQLGSLYYDGEGVRRDASKALALWQPACERGDGQGCAHAGAAYFDGDHVPRDRRMAAEFWEKGCAVGNADCCYYLGTGVVGSSPTARARAAAYLKKGCEGGRTEACTEYGKLISESGVATESSSANAEPTAGAANGVPQPRKPMARKPLHSSSAGPVEPKD
jgi:TPR repeat protein/thiol-disulfide isomerase/thioredoxin